MSNKTGVTVFTIKTLKVLAKIFLPQIKAVIFFAQKEEIVFSQNSARLRRRR